MEGLDDIGLTLKDQDAIDSFEKRHRTERPWLFRDGKMA